MSDGTMLPSNRKKLDEIERSNRVYVYRPTSVNGFSTSTNHDPAHRINAVLDAARKVRDYSIFEDAAHLLDDAVPQLVEALAALDGE